MYILHEHDITPTGTRIIHWLRFCTASNSRLSQVHLLEDVKELVFLTPSLPMCPTSILWYWYFSIVKMSATIAPEQDCQSLRCTICRNSRPATRSSQICFTNLSRSLCPSPGQWNDYNGLRIKPTPTKSSQYLRTSGNTRPSTHPTFLQKKSSTAGNLLCLTHRHLSALAFYDCTTWQLFQTQPLTQPPFMSWIPHEIFSFSTWWYCSLHWICILLEDMLFFQDDHEIGLAHLLNYQEI